MELISFIKYRKKVTVSEAKKGNKEAFLSLIDENRLNLYRVAKAMLSNNYDVEDALQNAIVKAYEKINTLKSDEYFRTWMVRILINECNLIIRKKKKIMYMEDNLDGIHNDNYENMDLTKAINSLNEELKVTTILFYFEDMTSKEISKFLKVPEGTIRSRLTRARQMLRQILKEV